MQALTHPGTIARLIPLLPATSLLFCAVQLQADNEGLGEDFWEKYDDIADWLTLRLKLTPEQEEAALPIPDENFGKKKAMLKKYGFPSDNLPELSRKQKEEIDAQMIAIRAQTRAQLVSVLDEKQLARIFHQAAAGRALA